MKYNNLALIMLILISLLHETSCGLIDEEKCKNEKVLTKSWSGDYDKLYNSENAPMVFFKLNESWEASQKIFSNYVFQINDACPYGALAIRIIIQESDGLGKPNDFEKVPQKYKLMIIEEKDVKGKLVLGKSKVITVDRNKISGVVHLNADIELDGFLEDGPRKYVIILGVQYPNIPAFDGYRGLVIENIKKVDFEVDYLQF